MIEKTDGNSRGKKTDNLILYTMSKEKNNTGRSQLAGLNLIIGLIWTDEYITFCRKKSRVIADVYIDSMILNEV